MRFHNGFFIVGIVVLLAIVTLIGLAARGNKRLANGIWGGVHIHIEVNNGVAQVEYDCANGEIPSPLDIDSQGHFSWRGFYTRESMGPIRVGRTPPRLAATYSGSISGDTMSLTVKLADGQVLDSFTLKRGAVGRIRKCR